MRLGNRLYSSVAGEARDTITSVYILDTPRSPKPHVRLKASPPPAFSCNSLSAHRCRLWQNYDHKLPQMPRTPTAGWRGGTGRSQHPSPCSTAGHYGRKGGNVSGTKADTYTSVFGNCTTVYTSLCAFPNRMSESSVCVVRGGWGNVYGGETGRR